MRTVVVSNCRFGREAGGQHVSDAFEGSAIALIEGGEMVRVEIENGSELAGAVDDRHDDFRSRARIASDVAWKCMNIWHELRSQRAGGGSADTAAESNFHTSNGTLVGSNPQKIICDDSVKAGPARPIEIVVQDTGYTGHRRDRVSQSVQQGLDLLGGGFVNRIFVDLHGRIVTRS